MMINLLSEPVWALNVVLISCEQTHITFKHEVVAVDGLFREIVADICYSSSKKENLHFLLCCDYISVSDSCETSSLELQ